MKHLKMFVLTATAAISLLAATGAGSAAATTLFTDSAETIDYPAGTVVEESLAPNTSFTFESSTSSLVTCTSVTTKRKSTNTTATWIEFDLESWSFSGCSSGTIPVSFGLDKIDHVTSTGGEIIGKSNSVTLEIFGVSCTYGTAEGTKLGTISSGSEPKVVVSAVVPKVAGGFLCPSQTTWTGQFIVTSPHALTIGP